MTCRGHPPAHDHRSRREACSALFLRHLSRALIGSMDSHNSFGPSPRIIDATTSNNRARANIPAAREPQSTLWVKRHMDNAMPRSCRAWALRLWTDTAYGIRKRTLVCERTLWLKTPSRLFLRPSSQRCSSFRHAVPSVAPPAAGETNVMCAARVAACVPSAARDAAPVARARGRGGQRHRRRRTGMVAVWSRDGFLDQ